MINLRNRFVSDNNISREIETISAKIPAPRYYPSLGTELLVDTHIPISPFHQLYIKRIINYDNISYWEVVLETDIKEDHLVEISFGERNDSAATYSLSLPYILPLEEDQHYLIYARPLELFENDELIINHLSAKVLHAQNIIVDLKQIKEGQTLFSYLGWHVKIDEINKVADEKPIHIGLTYLFSSPFAKQSMLSNLFSFDNQHQFIVEQPGTHNQVIFYAVDRLDKKIKPEEKVIHQNINFNYMNRNIRYDGDSPEFAEVVQEGILNPEWDYSLQLPNIIINFQHDQPLRLPLTKTERFYEVR